MMIQTLPRAETARFDTVPGSVCNDLHSAVRPRAAPAAALRKQSGELSDAYQPGGVSGPGEALAVHMGDRTDLGVSGS